MNPSREQVLFTGAFAVLAGVVGGAYLLGAIPFGLVVGRAFRGIDIREHGSRNLGATNAGRVLGPGWGVLVFALDFLKGLVPVLVAGALFGRGSLVPLAAAAAAVLGHVFPVWLGFRGGKGAAAGLGACFALAPLAAGVALGVFAATLALSRYVSLGSILAALALPPAFWLTEPERARENGGAVLLTLALLSLLVIVRHRSNIARLVHGTENRFGSRRTG